MKAGARDRHPLQGRDNSRNGHSARRRDARCWGAPRRALAVVVAVACSLVPCRADSDAEAAAFVARVNAAIDGIKARSANDLARGCRDYVGALVDVDAIVAVAIDGVADALAGTSKSAYRGAVESRMERQCVADAEAGTMDKAAMVGVRRTELGDLLVATRIESGGSESHVVVWRLPASRRGDKAVDLQIDGRSVALTFRDRAKQAYDRSGGDWEAVIRSAAQ